jgi:hypothetical protein
VLQHAQAFVAQRQHRIDGFAVASAAPQRTGDAGGAQDVAIAFAQLVKDAARGGQLVSGLGQGAEMQPVETACQAGPGFGVAVVRGLDALQRAFGTAQCGRSIGMQARPGLARESARAVVDGSGVVVLRPGRGQ